MGEVVQFPKKSKSAESTNEEKLTLEWTGGPFEYRETDLDENIRIMLAELGIVDPPVPARKCSDTYLTCKPDDA